jgi:hypothetical protein
MPIRPTIENHLNTVAGEGQTASHYSKVLLITFSKWCWHGQTNNKISATQLPEDIDKTEV